MRITVLGILPVVLCAALPYSARARGRIVVIGFGGVDSSIVEEKLAKGQLPNLPPAVWAKRTPATPARSAAPR